MNKVGKVPIEEAWQKWIECLSGTDSNSIFNQISAMVWDTAIFRIINDGRQIQVDKNASDPQLNGSLHTFINKNYFLSQLSCVRRLTDQSSELTGKRGVYSIYALLDDIQNRRIELTREVLLRLRKMPYDLVDVQEKRREFYRQHHKHEAVEIPQELDWESIEETHQVFDRLSNTISTNRQPGDIISDKVFIKLKEALQECKVITDFVDKFIAHSSTPESRTLQNYQTTSITLGKLWNAQKIVFEVAEFISVNLFSAGHMALPIESANFLEYWDVPIFENNERTSVLDVLKKYRKETQKWNLTGIDNVWKWVETETI